MAARLCFLSRIALSSFCAGDIVIASAARNCQILGVCFQYKLLLLFLNNMSFNSHNDLSAIASCFLLSALTLSIEKESG